jgi:mRNA interferase RelE/StbE
VIVSIDKSFEKDVKKIKDKKIKEKIAFCIEELQEAKDFSAIKSIKKLKGGDIFFRIRILDYRLGLVFENNEVTMIRFLHRKDIYAFFPKNKKS